MFLFSESDFTADENGEAEITYGTAVGDAKVFMISSNNDGRIIGHRWLAPARGVDKGQGKTSVGRHADKGLFLYCQPVAFVEGLILYLLNTFRNGYFAVKPSVIAKCCRSNFSHS